MKVPPDGLGGGPGHHGGQGVHIRLPDGPDGAEVLPQGLPPLGAQAGDAVAKEVLAEYIEDLACGLANLINILQPQVLCIGGGICKQGENLMVPLRAALDREEFTKDAAHRTEVCIAKLGNDAGIIGGAVLPLYR